MPPVLTSAADATPAWLTETLHATGVLPQGTVVATDLIPGNAFNSQIARLTLRYSADTPPDAPARLLLKLNTEHDGQAEAGFYQLAARERAHLPMLVPCYAASYDAASGASHCLLLDLSATHGPPVSRVQVLALQGVPSEQHLLGIVDALAAFHAVWWEHPQLGAVVGVTEVSHWYRDAEHFAAHVERAQGHWAQLVREEGTWLPADVRERCTWILARLPRLWERYLAPRVAARHQLTLGDRDGYFNQYLCPYAGSGQTYKVDFQDISADFGAIDLVYLFATFWTTQIRKEGGREAQLMHRYHAGLMRSGVKNYPFEQLMDDYRTMITMTIWVAVWDQTYGSGTSYWWPKLQCLLQAYNDLDCDRLVS
jgi:hypothetical protein